jgi:hypothetical protein
VVRLLFSMATAAGAANSHRLSAGLRDWRSTSWLNLGRSSSAFSKTLAVAAQGCVTLPARNGDAYANEAASGGAEAAQVREENNPRKGAVSP